MKLSLSALALTVTIFLSPLALAAETPNAAAPDSTNATATAGSSVSSDPFAGFTTCDAPSDRWVIFYHTAWEEVQQAYYDASVFTHWADWEHKFDAHLCTKEDLDKALKLMTESVGNPWTRYTSLDEIIQHDTDLKNGVGQIGFELVKSGNAYKIEFIHFGSPAQASLLQEGDIVKTIDGADISGLDKAQIKAILNGPSGKKMKVVASHNGVDETVDLTFAPTPDAAVDARLLAPDAAYVRLPDFGSEKKIADFIGALSDLDRQGTGLKRVILDLRGDPGGDMPNAISTASLFLQDNQVIVKNYVRTTDPQIPSGIKETVFTTTPARSITVKGAFIDENFVNKLRQVKLVVLTNGSTASAAEILTGALKDNNRGVIIGTHTFGKGVGYLTHRLPTGGLLSISEMRYVTPSGYDVSGKGIDPNIVIEHVPGAQKDEQLERALKELGL